MVVPLRALALAFALAAFAAPPAHALEPPIARTPTDPRGTVVLLPGSGWATPTPAAQQTIWSNLAPTLFRAGYRVVAIDYEAGRAGLGSVRAVVGAERERLRGGPLCLYGESSGGHLALLLANRMRAIDCVIGFGAPTSFTAFADAAAAHPEKPGYTEALETAIKPAFGPDPASWASWEPASIVTPVRARVLLMICADDPLVPVDQIDHLPGAEKYVPPRGDGDDPSDRWVHGTVSDAGRRAVLRRVVGFLGRALSARRS